MSLLAHSLPPPAIFTHNETLHAILLPPLATFLSSLSEPPHLLKLNDILDRFRTPKSYHRVDVRLVESSELPPTSDDGRADTRDDLNGDGQGSSNEIMDGTIKAEGEGEDDEKRTEVLRAGEKADKGEPIILEEGVTVEEYLSRRQPADLGKNSEVDDGALLDVPPGGDSSPAPRCLTNAYDEKEGGPAPHDALPITPASPTIPYIQPAQALDETIQVQIRLSPSRTSHIHAPSPHDGPPSPVPSHPLPPSGPKRRIRELRLDLRTLDAAALFALETWRREILGLQKLELERPDSIWYKGDFSPSPSPSPSPEPLPAPMKKRGRPPKLRPAEREEIIVVDEQDGEKGYESLMEALEQRVVSEITKGAVHVQTVIGASKEVADEQTKDTEVEPYGSPVFSHSEGEDELDELDQEDELEDSDRELSPDVILDDMFDSEEDLDPDFEPPCDPLPRNEDAGPSKARGSLDKGKGLTILPLSNSLHQVNNLELIDLTADSPTSTPLAGPSRTPLKTSTIRMNDPNARERHIMNTGHRYFASLGHTSSSLDAPLQYAKRTAGPIEPGHVSKGEAKGSNTERVTMRMVAVVVPQMKRAGPQKLAHFVEATKSRQIVDIDNQLLLPPFQRGSRKMVRTSLSKRPVNFVEKPVRPVAFMGRLPGVAKRKTEKVALGSDDEPLLPRNGRKRTIEHVVPDSDDEPLLPPLKRTSNQFKAPEVIEVVSDEEEEEEEPVEEKFVPTFVPARPRDPDEEWDFLRDM